MDVLCIVAAAGQGERFGGRRKQYVDLQGVPVLIRALLAFEQVSAVREIRIAVPSGDEDYVRRLTQRYDLKKISRVAPGGEARDASVRVVLTSAPRADVVLVHDGVRPLVTPSLIESVIEAAWKTGAAVPVVQPTDTVKRGMQGQVAETLERSSLWLAQTPQGFRWDVLYEAYECEGSGATDDAALVERLGHPVAMVPGDAKNLKLTTPSDLVIAEALLRS